MPEANVDLISEMMKYNSFIAKEQQDIKNQLIAHQANSLIKNEEYMTHNLTQDRQLNDINISMKQLSCRLDFLEEKSELLTKSNEDIQISIADLRDHLDNGWRTDFIAQQHETFDKTFNAMHVQITTLTDVVKAVTQGSFGIQTEKERLKATDCSGKWSLRKQILVTLAAILGSGSLATIIQMLLNK